LTPPGRPSLLLVLSGASFGGVERQAELLAEAARQDGHQVSLVVLGGEGPALPRFRPHCRSIQTLNADLRNDLQIHRRLRAAARPGHDIAFLFSTGKFTVLSHALRPVVSHQILHVGNPAGSSLQERWKQQVRCWLFPPAPGLCLIANSQYTLGSLRAHPFYRRFPLRVSLNCVRVPEGPAHLREQCAPVRIGMVARLDYIKDHATLIRAVGLLKREGVSVECELVGEGPMEGRLRQLAAAEGLAPGEAVTFAGRQDDIGSALRRWDIFVFSTSAQEGFGNAAAEAMAYGLPTILTDVGPSREVGADAVAYVPPANPGVLAQTIRTLAKDFGRRRELGTAARERARRHFSARRKLDDFLAGAGRS
jgi:glycosyltransferase involved in cell wall biosynthesis